MKKIEAIIKPEPASDRVINAGNMERRQQQQQPRQQSVFAD